EKSANYIIRQGSADLGRRTLEGSRPALAIFLDAALRIIGARGYEALIDAGILRARHMAQAINDSPAFELTSSPALNILTYRYLPEWARPKATARDLDPADNERINELNRRLHAEQARSGTSFISRTLLGHTA